MTAHDSAHAAADNHVEHDHVKIYLRVFAALAVFTALEYFYAKIFKDGFVVLILGLMTLAIIKAAELRAAKTNENVRVMFVAVMSSR